MFSLVKKFLFDLEPADETARFRFLIVSNENDQIQVIANEKKIVKAEFGRDEDESLRMAA
jgi:hypothetical protein